MDENVVEVKTNKKGKKTIVIVIIITILLVGCAIGSFFLFFNGDKSKKDKSNKVTKKEEIKKSAYYIKDNSIQDFDLQFLKLENGEKNIIYSPLSIKYALQMLKEGANGDTKTQIESVIGDYSSKKYTNSNNLSLANGFFIRDTYKDSIKKTYTDKLVSKYNADVVYDSFSSPDAINNWVLEH